ncbi:metallophosphoesterase [Halanaerobaculum tunisiense]
MRVAVFSDAHGRSQQVRQALEQLSDIDYLLYAGDGVEDLLNSNFLTDIETIVVPGNRDFGVELPKERIVELAKQRIFLTHGNNYNIKWGLDKLYYRAQEEEADIVIFGHTHRKLAQEIEGTLFFNPGSIALPRDSRYGSYGVLEIESRELDYHHHQLSD